MPHPDRRFSPGPGHASKHSTTHLRKFGCTQWPQAENLPFGKFVANTSAKRPQGKQDVLI